MWTATATECRTATTTAQAPHAATGRSAVRRSAHCGLQTVTLQADISIDGLRDSAYPAAAALQTVGYRNFGVGNQLAGLYAVVDEHFLYLMFTGDVEINDRVLVLLDTTSGGHSTLGNLSSCSRDAFNPGSLHGMVLEEGFLANFLVSIESNAYSLHRLSASPNDCVYLESGSV